MEFPSTRADGGIFVVAQTIPIDCFRLIRQLRIGETFQSHRRHVAKPRDWLEEGNFNLQWRNSQRIIFVVISDRKLVLDVVQEMPETASLQEIVDELLLLTTVKERLARAEKGQRGVPHEDVVKMLDQWITE
jgi:hypothetical protein